MAHVIDSACPTRDVMMGGRKLAGPIPAVTVVGMVTPARRRSRITAKAEAGRIDKGQRNAR